MGRVATKQSVSKSLIKVLELSRNEDDSEYISGKSLSYIPSE